MPLGSSSATPVPRPGRPGWAMMRRSLLVPADAVMDQNTLPKVQMPNRNGFIVDDRPDTKALRCMDNCG